MDILALCCAANKITDCMSDPYEVSVINWFVAPATLRSLYLDLPGWMVCIIHLMSIDHNAQLRDKNKLSICFMVLMQLHPYWPTGLNKTYVDVDIKVRTKLSICSYSCISATVSLLKSFIELMFETILCVHGKGTYDSSKWYTYLVVGYQILPVMSILTDFALDSRKNFYVGLLMSSSKEIW